MASQNIGSRVTILNVIMHTSYYSSSSSTTILSVHPKACNGDRMDCFDTLTAIMLDCHQMIAFPVNMFNKIMYPRINISIV